MSPTAARLHVQNNHTPKVHQPQLASEVLSVLFLCQRRAVGISSTLQHPECFLQPRAYKILHHGFVSKQMCSKHGVNPNQTNFWHEILWHRSVLCSHSNIKYCSVTAVSAVTNISIKSDHFSMGPLESVDELTDHPKQLLRVLLGRFSEFNLNETKAQLLSL